jgi:hypothetical protein
MQVIVSYAILASVAVETLVVYNVANYDKVTEFFRGQQRSRQKRAELYRQMRQEAGLGVTISSDRLIFSNVQHHIHNAKIVLLECPDV